MTIPKVSYTYCRPEIQQSLDKKEELYLAHSAHPLDLSIFFELIDIEFWSVIQWNFFSGIVTDESVYIGAQRYEFLEALFYEAELTASIHRFYRLEEKIQQFIYLISTAHAQKLFPLIEAYRQNNDPISKEALRNTQKLLLQITPLSLQEGDRGVFLGYTREILESGDLPSQFQPSMPIEKINKQLQLHHDFIQIEIEHLELEEIKRVYDKKVVASEQGSQLNALQEMVADKIKGIGYFHSIAEQKQREITPLQEVFVFLKKWVREIQDGMHHDPIIYLNLFSLLKTILSTYRVLLRSKFMMSVSKVRFAEHIVNRYFSHDDPSLRARLERLTHEKKEDRKKVLAFLGVHEKQVEFDDDSSESELSELIANCRLTQSTTLA